MKTWLLIGHGSRHSDYQHQVKIITAHTKEEATEKAMLSRTLQDEQDQIMYEPAQYIPATFSRGMRKPEIMIERAWPYE